MSLAEAVEDLARAMEWLVDPFPSQVLERRELPTTSFVLVTKAPATAERCEIAVVGRGEIAGHAVTFVEAMLVLRCGLLGTTRVRCPTCEGGWVHHKDEQVWPTPQRVSSDLAYARRVWAGIGYRVASEVANKDPRSAEFGVITLRVESPCPTCTGPAVECSTCAGTGKRPEWSGCGTMDEPHRVDCQYCGRTGTIPGKPTGHVDRSWAEVLLGAMPPPGCARLRGGMCDALDCDHKFGDPEARAKLTRIADDLMSPALDPLDEARRSMAESKARCDLGLWLALYLGQPCDVCEGRRTSDRTFGIPCEPCAGSGLALGHHADAMAEAGLSLAEELGLEAAE